MARLNFKSVSVRNFFSYGNVPTKLELDNVDYNLVVGKNGCGKSTILLDGLSFALFNKPYKKINKSGVINSLNRKQCVVEVEFFIGSRQYKVTRGMKPNLFEIRCDGEIINPPTDNKDYQKILEEQILRMSHKTFCQVVILGTANFVPFMQLTPANRREVVDDLLDAEVYTVMAELLKERIKDRNTQLTKLKNSKSESESKIEMLQGILSKIQKDTSNQVEQFKGEIETLTKTIASIKQTLQAEEVVGNGLSARLNKFGDVTSKLSKYKTYYSQIANKKKTLYTQRQWYEETTDCPTCKQQIFEDTKESMVTTIQANLSEIESGIVDLTEKITLLSEANEKRDEVKTLLLASERKQSTLKSDIISNSSIIQRLEKQIASLSVKTENEDDIKFSIRQISESVTKLSSDLTKLEEESRIQGLASLMLKDGGIKTNIIKQYIPVFNHLINKYLEALGLFVSFELDENFNESVKSRHRDEFTYDSFSEGQKSRINLAILFAWREVAALKNSASANILVLDEVLDSSMDFEGTENLTNLLTQELKGSNIYVISHANQDSYEHIFNRTIEVKMVNGYSEIYES